MRGDGKLSYGLVLTGAILAFILGCTPRQRDSVTKPFDPLVDYTVSLPKQMEYSIEKTWDRLTGRDRTSITSPTFARKVDPGEIKKLAGEVYGRGRQFPYGIVVLYAGRYQKDKKDTEEKSLYIMINAQGGDVRSLDVILYTCSDPAVKDHLRNRDYVEAAGLLEQNNLAFARVLDIGANGLEKGDVLESLDLEEMYRCVSGSEGEDMQGIGNESYYDLLFNSISGLKAIVVPKSRQPIFK